MLCIKQPMILFSCVVCLALQAQEKDAGRKVIAGINFSPDYSFRTLLNRSGNPSGNLVISVRDQDEKAKLGYTTGLSLMVNFSRQIALETGLQYANKGYKTNDHEMVFYPPSPTSPKNIRINYAYHYIGIPLKAKFSFGREKLRFLSGIGFVASWLMRASQTSYYTYSDGRPVKKEHSTLSGFKKVDMSPVLSVGMDYRLGNRLHLVAEPTVRYGILNTTEAPVTEHLWSGGLNTGLYYRLK